MKNLKKKLTFYANAYPHYFIAVPEIILGCWFWRSVFSSKESEIKLCCLDLRTYFSTPVYIDLPCLQLTPVAPKYCSWMRGPKVVNSSELAISLDPFRIPIPPCHTWNPIAIEDREMFICFHGISLLLMRILQFLSVRKQYCGNVWASSSLF